MKSDKSNYNALLDNAANAIVADDREFAQGCIEAVLGEASNIAETWIVKAWTEDSLTKAEEAIRQALVVDPKNEIAAAGLEWIEGIGEIATLQLEAKRQAEEEARAKTEAAAKRQAEKEARVKAEAEAKRQADEEARLAFEAQQKLEAELEQQAELERHNLQLEEDAARLAEQKDTESTLEMNSCSPEVELKENLDAFVQEVQDEIEATGKQEEPVSPAVESDAKKQVILAVDDSPTIRKLLSLTLSGEGYEVLTAADGIEALNILSERIPDLILTDINMPKLNGYKLCKFVKKHERTQMIPVVMLSGKDGVFDKMRGKMNGCDDYITKPFESAELVAKVRETLSGVASN